MKRNLLDAILFEQDGDLNLGQLICFVLVLVFGVCFLKITFEPTTQYNLFVKIAGWSALGGFLTMALLAALPPGKEKILANAKAPGEIAKAIGISAPHEVSQSTDIQELRSQPENTIG